MRHSSFDTNPMSPNRRALRVATVVLLLELTLLVVAHRGEANGAGIDVSVQNAPKPPPQDHGNSGSYWSLSEHATIMYWHIALEILGWIVILPIGKYTLSSGEGLTNMEKLSC